MYYSANSLLKIYLHCVGGQIKLDSVKQHHGELPLSDGKNHKQKDAYIEKPGPFSKS